MNVHVESGDGYCEYWINPVTLAYSTGYDAAERKTIKKLVQHHCVIFPV